MKTRLAAAAAIFLWLGTPAAAHRLDEYLQATTISVGKDRVEAQMRLTPGVAVFPIVIAAIDTDGDGVITETEQRDYARRIVRDLSLTIDGEPLRMRVVSFKFAAIDEMKEGRGEIQLELHADVARGAANRKLVFENRHHSPIAAYLVNGLVPGDPGIRLAAQNRNYEQSVYQLDYVQDAHSGPPFLSWPSLVLVGAGAGALLFAQLAFKSWRRGRAVAQR